MIGITSFGGYIPRLRLNRMSIYENMGWFAPAIVMVAQGERSFCNHDEDSLTMAVASSRDCLAGLDKSKVDGHYLCSTTLPFSDRLNAGIVKTALNLRDDIAAADFASSLRSGTTAMIAALEAVKAGDKHQVLVTATDKREARSAYFYEMWFGDGAASVLVGDEGVVAEYLGSHTVSYDFVDHFRGDGHQYDYMWEERWVRDEGYSRIIPEAINGLFEKLSITMDDVDTLVFPCFFKAEHRKIAKKLGAAPEKVVDNFHEACGETGAAHAMVMLSHALEGAKPGDRILVCGFGQGCDALYFKVTDEIEKLPARVGIRGSLENKLVSNNYPKFQKFRNLMLTEMGIRAEAPSQTAMTVLWRKRKMILGLVGGKCKKCGTPQFPKMDICVNPKCGALKSQEDYEFTDVPATVKSFTGDLLSVSIDPPNVYGMIQFEGGGRMMADFTDCVHSEVSVGQKVTLAFRRRYQDNERGFSGYFWKAIPDPASAPAAADGPEIRFDGQVAVVTGAGAGLGRTYALELARRGARVVVNDLGGARDGTGESTSAADDVVKEIQDLGGEAVASYDSVATAEGGQAIVDKAIEAFGRIDVLVNNAGILRDTTFAKLEADNWNLVLGVHLDGAYNVTRPAFQKMKEAGYGRIVMTSSAAGLYGNFGQSNYSAAKLGVVGLMNTLKLEGGKYDIHVNTVAPLATTRMTTDILPEDLQDKTKSEFVTPVVVYLCSKGSKENGLVFNAGMGHFSHSTMVQGPGTVVADEGTAPTPEDIHRHWEDINTLEGATQFANATESLGPMMDAYKPKKEPAADTGGGGGGLTVATVFEKMPEVFNADKAAGVDVIFQYKISGGGGGEWYVTIKDATCEVCEGVHSSPTTTILMGEEDFIGLMEGKVNAMKAYTTGKLKIEGDLMKSQLIEKLFSF